MQERNDGGGELTLATRRAVWRHDRPEMWATLDPVQGSLSRLCRWCRHKSAVTSAHTSGRLNLLRASACHEGSEVEAEGDASGCNTSFTTSRGPGPRSSRPYTSHHPQGCLRAYFAGRYLELPWFSHSDRPIEPRTLSCRMQ